MTSSPEFKCNHCHRLTDETTCPLCGSVCRKRKGVKLVQDALRWPSAQEKAVKSEIPSQLRSLVKKCPQWEERIVALVKTNPNYRHFTYKEMETEITQRETLKTVWRMLNDKAINIVDGIQARADKLYNKTSFPLSEQKNFESSVEHKTANFRKLSNNFLFGGEVYVRSRATKSQMKGLLEMKDNANRFRDVQMHEELVGYLNETNNFTSFLANDLPEITAFLKERASIMRQYNLDSQAKGVAGATVRRNAKSKRDEQLKALGGGRSTFVPMVRKILDLRREEVKKGQCPVGLDDIPDSNSGEYSSAKDKIEGNTGAAGDDRVEDVGNDIGVTDRIDKDIYSLGRTSSLECIPKEQGRDGNEDDDDDDDDEPWGEEFN